MTYKKFNENQKKQISFYLIIHPMIRDNPEFIDKESKSGMKLCSGHGIINIFTVISIAAFSYSAQADPFWVFFMEDSERTAGDPVSSESIEALELTGAAVRVISRYFNAVSVNWDGDVRILEAFSMVRSVKPVKSMARIRRVTEEQEAFKEGQALHRTSHELNYGYSYEQLNILNIPKAHDMGYSGRGVVVGILDSGFDIAGTSCLEETSITHTKNFIDGGDDVTGDDHGGYVLSCLAGAKDGEYYGAAYGASFLLAKTDDIYSERRADEDRWVAAVEWCDSLGADIISSSLVYNLFDTVEESYSKEDMDGQTSLVARAAEIAVTRGIVVVNAAGNEGNNSWGIITTPGDSEHVIAVGAVTYSGGEPLICSFSSWGPTADGRIKPDVVAPGSRVAVPLLGFSGSYITKDGTSFATPFISGICALLLEAHPGWTPPEVMDALKLTSADLGDTGADNEYGWGLPDAVNALNFQAAAVERNLLAHNMPHEKESLQYSAVPLRIDLNPPFPNPFNGKVTIPFTCFERRHVVITIHDVTGQIITTLLDEPVSAGRHRVTWNGKPYSSGIYFAKATASGKSSSKKIMMIK